MPFLAEVPCLEHGKEGRSGVCCPGLTAWPYDAKTGIAYNTFMCWGATCAENGQYSGPNGSNAGKCCSQYAVDGRCAPKPQQQADCVAIGKAPLAGQACCSGLVRDSSGLCNVPDEDDWMASLAKNSNLIMYGGIALLALLLLSKKR